jgi:large subunit ribosomal protein L6
LSYPVSPFVQVAIEGSSITLSTNAIERRDYAQWGLVWALAHSMIQGVTGEFKKTLEIQGVGYRCEIAGNKLTLAVGFSHKVTLSIPTGVTVVQDSQNPNVLIITGMNAQQV